MHKAKKSPEAQPQSFTDKLEPDWRICTVCGQIYDLRKFDEAYYHGPHAHRPKLATTDR